MLYSVRRRRSDYGASELAAEIDSLQIAKEKVGRATLDAFAVIENNADELWGISADATADGVRELAEVSRVAKDAYLRNYVEANSFVEIWDRRCLYPRVLRLRIPSGSGNPRPI
jgi:hypothetical protein